MQQPSRRRSCPDGLGLVAREEARAGLRAALCLAVVVSVSVVAAGPVAAADESMDFVEAPGGVEERDVGDGDEEFSSLDAGESRPATAARRRAAERTGASVWEPASIRLPGVAGPGVGSWRGVGSAWGVPTGGEHPLVTPSAAGRRGWVELLGGVTQAAEGTRETWVMATVSLSLPFLGQTAPPGAWTPPAEPAPSVTPPVAPRSASSGTPQSSASPIPLLDAALARGAVEAALRVAGCLAAEATEDGLEARSRSAAVLPEVRVRAGRTTDESLRLTPTTDEPERYTQSGAATLVFELRLVWELDRLLYSADEIAIERLRAQERALRADLTERVLKALFDWQRAVSAARAPDLTPELRAQADLALLFAAVELDVLTGGWFGVHAPSR